ncbi:MAG: hypothetical protein ACK4EY_15035 [Flavipsychrobacter sp.]
MGVTALILHFVLAIILFLIINWVGKHSYSVGYMQISMFVKIEEAPAFNFLLRVLTPTVFLIIVSAILYYLELDRYVVNIYLVSLYYIIFRLGFNLVTNRGKLLNWYRQIVHWIAIMTISYLVYDKIIKNKTNILPDFTTISNELWIIILVFVFQIFNNVRFSQEATKRRKLNFIKARYIYFKNKYYPIIKRETKNEILEALTFSIMIYEDFNRPKVIRYIENIRHGITNKPHTLGVMQVKTEKRITDKESVIIGTKKIVKSYYEYVESLKDSEYGFNDYSAYWFIIEQYNIGDEYSSEIIDLFNILKDEFYKNSKDTLNPDTTSNSK